MITDAYLIPLQEDIILQVKDCLFISIIDCTSFFYQWRVHSDDHHKLTIVLHCDQETSNVTLMGAKNSISYVQRQIDRILSPFAKFTKAYIDNVMIHSLTLEEHLTHLRTIFKLFLQLRIFIKSIKAFLGYPDVHLLRQWVNSFSLTTTEEKLKAISLLKFPCTLRKLETYIGMTGWL